MAELSSGAFCLKGHIDVPEDRAEFVKAALAEHIRLTRDEPGCIFFNVEPCSDVAGRFTVSEAFVDKQAFDAHQERARNSPWAAASAGIPREYKTWTVE
ncbi:MAG: antibiotic biosynthesis monooxygenase [Pseudomonadota bacterium]